MQKLSAQSKTIIKFLISAIILLVPLYPKFPFLNVPGTYVSIRLEDFLIFVTFAVWTFFYLTKVVKNYLSNKLEQKELVGKYIILFWLVTGISVMSGVFITQTVSPGIGILHWVRRIEYMGMFFVGITAISSIKDIKYYIKLLLIVIFISFVFGIGQKYFNWPVITTQNSEYAQGVALRYMPGGHLVSTFAGHYDLASFIIFISPLLYVLISTKRNNKSLINPRIEKLVLFTALGAGFWLMVNAASRISIVSYLISSSLGLLLVKKYKYIPVLFIICFIFVAFSTNLIDRYSRIFQVTIQKLFIQEKIMYVIPKIDVYAAEESAPIALPIEDRSTSIRLNIEWPRAIRAFTKNPLLGTGYSSITLATDNDYLRLLGETGIYGTIAFFLILIHLVFLFIKKIKIGNESIPNLFAIGIFSSLPGILLNALFIDIFEASKFAILFWLMVGFAVKALFLKHEN